MSDKDFQKQYEEALKAGEEANRTEARAVAAHYDAARKEVVVDLRGGGPFVFSINLVAGLRNASEADLAEVEITPSGEGLHWERLDEDLSLPALVKGHYGPGYHVKNVAELESLKARLETGWLEDRDASIVDRLAAAHPQYSNELYEFFSVLIESELDENVGDADGSAQAARKWLEAEGFQAARRAADETQKMASTPTPASPTPPGSPDAGRALEPTEELMVQPGPPRSNVLSFSMLTKKKLNKSSDAAAEEMGLPGDLITIVNRAPPGEQQKVRTEISRRAAAIGLDEQEAFRSLESSQRMAARDRSKGPPPSFRQQLKHLVMPPEQLEFWLNLADEEDEA